MNQLKMQNEPSTTTGTGGSLQNSGKEEEHAVKGSFDWERTKPSVKGTSTISGREVFYGVINPSGAFNIEDIAHSLSIQNRFIGHTKHPYSVAQHCVNCVAVAIDVYKINDSEFLLNLLMHDAAEAYIGDIISPVKKLLYEAIAGGNERMATRMGYMTGDNYPSDADFVVRDLLLTATNMEERLEADIARTFRLTPLTHSDRLMLNEIDSRMCATESERLCARRLPPQMEPYELDDMCFQHMPFLHVRDRFLRLFNTLIQERGNA